MSQYYKFKNLNNYIYKNINMNIPSNDWKDFFAENNKNIITIENEVSKDKYFPEKSLIFKSSTRFSITVFLQIVANL